MILTKREHTKLLLGSIAMDLKRVALGYHRGSDTMANRFLWEAVKRGQQVDKNSVKPYLRELLDNIERLQFRKDKEKIAEESLLYSILLQNAATAS